MPQMRPKLQSSVQIIGVAIAAILFVIIFSILVPFNMDEFYEFWLLVCVGKSETHLGSPCDKYALDWLGTGLVLPLRAYYYMGSLPGFLYAPLYYLWPSPASARLLGVLYLVIQAHLLSCISGHKARTIFFGLLLFFPYAFQHIVDTGVIGVHLLCLYLLYIFGDKWFATAKTRYVAGMAVVLFCGLWTKLTFLWFLPGIAIFWAIQAYEHKAQYWEKRRQVLLYSCVALSLCELAWLSIVFSPPADFTETHRSFWNEITRSEHTSPAMLLAEGASYVRWMVQHISNPFNATHFIYKVQNLPVLTTLYGLLLFGWLPITVCWVAKYYPSHSSRRALGLLCGGIIVLACVLMLKGAGKTHHFMLASGFFMLAIVELSPYVFANIKKNLRYVLYGLLFVFAVLNVFAWSTFWTQPIRWESTPEKKIVRSILRSDVVGNNFFILNRSWGISIDTRLYNHPNQLERRLKRKSLKTVRTYYAEGKKSGKSMLMTYNKKDRKLDIQTTLDAYTLTRCVALTELENWQILYEPHAELDALCRHIQQRRNFESVWDMLWFNVWISLQ